MGAPVGNKNAATTKRPWAEALQRALEAHKPIEQRQKLDALAVAVIEKAMSGDVQAIKEIGDRLDGKPRQQTEIMGENGGAVQFARIERVITDPKK
jgi:hypothetical protein